jgi:hypothetical protein
MNLATASRWFAQTSLDGMVDGEWRRDIARVTWTPHDQFVSDQEFGHKVRSVLASPHDEQLLRCPLVRVSLEPDQIYMVRTPNIDRRSEPYQIVLSLHEARFTAVLLKIERIKLASGVEGAQQQVELARSPCDVQPVTFVTSDLSPSVRFGDAICVLPRTTPIDSTMLIEIPEQFSLLEVRHVYEAHGNLYARGILQRKHLAERETL